MREVSKEVLEKLLDKGYSSRRIADELGVPRWRVKKLVRELGLQDRYKHTPRKFQILKAKFERLVEEGKTKTEIARELGVQLYVIGKWCKKYGYRPVIRRIDERLEEKALEILQREKVIKKPDFCKSLGISEEKGFKKLYSRLKEKGKIASFSLIFKGRVIRGSSKYSSFDVFNGFVGKNYLYSDKVQLLEWLLENLPYHPAISHTLAPGNVPKDVVSLYSFISRVRLGVEDPCLHLGVEVYVPRKVRGDPEKLWDFAVSILKHGIPPKKKRKPREVSATPLSPLFEESYI